MTKKKQVSKTGSLGSHPYDNGPLRTNKGVKTKQQYCYMCGAVHDYHLPDQLPST